MNNASKNLATVREDWDSNADQWVRQIRSGQDVYRNEFLEPAFTEFIGDISGVRVLDGACGEGTSSRILARAGARVSGIDLSHNMISSAKQLEADHPLGIAYFEGSATDMPFADGSFDLVTSWMAMHDISSPLEVLKEFSRVIRPGGRLAFCIRHPAFFTRRTGFLRGNGTSPSGLLIGDYFNKNPWTEHWAFAGGDDATQGRKTFSNLRFPISLSDCINGVIQAGMAIEKIAEPMPSEELCARHPRLDFWRHHAALYLFVSAIKPVAGSQ